mgnify:CR=1 FL=1
MIDSHFHLEQPQYKDREALIKEWKRDLSGVITSCANPRDLDVTLGFVKKWPSFVKATAGLHPQYVNDFSQEQVNEYLEKIKQNQKSFVGIGEIGLDFHWIKDIPSQEKSKELFRKLLGFAQDLKKPVVIHNWESGEDTIKILEEFSPKKVQMHMWGERKLLDKIIQNNWYISVGPVIFKSKERKKIIRDFPLERIFLETDSPWFPMGEDKIGYPTNIRKVAERVAEIKKLDFETVWKVCGENVKKFFIL